MCINVQASEHTIVVLVTHVTKTRQDPFIQAINYREGYVKSTVRNNYLILVQEKRKDHRGIYSQTFTGHN